jgi:hypothetical protein
LAGRERDVLEQDASCLRAHWFVQSVRRDAVAELCTRDAARSEERSCAAQGAAADLRRPEALLDAALRVQPEAQKRLQPKARQERLAQLSGPRAALRAAAAEARPLVMPAQIPRQRAFPPAQILLEAEVRTLERAAVLPAVVRQQT